MHPASATALLGGVVDYAGLFPPAALSMDEAVAEYHRARGSADAWMLGRFVVPAARLAELAEALMAMPPRLDVWDVSAIVRAGSDTDITAITDFNAAGARHLARVDTIECKPQTLEGIDWLATRGLDGSDIYVEIAPGALLEPLLAGVAVHELRAKVRTGGVTDDAFPSPSALTSCLVAMVGHGIAFKATAGLHHAVRGQYRLTSEDGAAAAPMYGYLNVLLATAALRMGRPAAVAETILQETDADALVFSDDDVRWGEEAFPLSQLRDTRTHHLVSFGSCSFREPAEELGALLSR